MSADGVVRIWTNARPPLYVETVTAMGYDPDEGITPVTSEKPLKRKPRTRKPRATKAKP